MARPDLLTVAEASGYRATSRHADVLAFIEALRAARSPHLRVESMGKSALGQDIPVLVLSAAGAFTPEAGRRSGAPIVLVLANIHAGEVEGKESVLGLAREILHGPLHGPLSRLAEGATLLLVPDYNPDGNDRIDPANRALDLARFEGQIGPESGVGTRTTAEGINLNRDYVKLEAVESRHLMRLYGAWRPHLTVDCHTTDGSIHAYHLTYDTAHLLPSSPAAPILYVRDTMLPAISRRLEARTAFRTFFYGNYRLPDDPESGWETYPGLPRFGSHYRGLTGRMDILLEAYSYLPFRERCAVMTATLEEILSYVGEHGPEMVRIVNEAEAETVRRGRDPAPDDYVGVSYAEARRGADGRLELAHPVHPLGGPVEILSWDLESLRARRIPGRELRRYRTTHYGRFVPTRLVRRPFAYLVPAAEARIAEHLRLHNLEVLALETAAEIPVEQFVVDAQAHTASPDIADQARPETLFFGHTEAATFGAAPGDFLVPTAQPFGHLAIYLLEPESDDGLVQWGFFPAVREGDVHPVRRVPRPLSPA